MAEQERRALGVGDLILELPPSWIGMDLTPRSAVQGFYGEIALDAVASGAAAAAGRIVECNGTTAAAALFVHVIDITDYLSADALREELEREKPGDLTPRIVESFNCSLGPSTRVSVMTVQPDEAKGLVVELVQHWISLAETAEAIVLSWSTPSLAFGEAFAMSYDASARSLRLRDDSSFHPSPK